MARGELGNRRRSVSRTRRARSFFRRYRAAAESAASSSLLRSARARSESRSASFTMASKSPAESATVQSGRPARPSRPRAFRRRAAEAAPSLRPAPPSLRPAQPSLRRAGVGTVEGASARSSFSTTRASLTAIVRCWPVRHRNRSLADRTADRHETVLQANVEVPVAVDSFQAAVKAVPCTAIWKGPTSTSQRACGFGTTLTCALPSLIPRRAPRGRRRVEASGRSGTELDDGAVREGQRRRLRLARPEWRRSNPTFPLRCARPGPRRARLAPRGKSADPGPPIRPCRDRRSRTFPSSMGDGVGPTVFEPPPGRGRAASATGGPDFGGPGG